MTRRAVSIAVLFIVAAGLLILAPHVLLTLFAGGLFGLFLRSGGVWIANRSGLPAAAGVGAFVLVIVAAIALVLVLAAPSVSRQISELAEMAPAAFSDLQAELGELPYGERLMRGIQPAGWLDEGQAVASSAAVMTFGALGSLIFVLFVGLYGALDPDRYRRGLIALLAPSVRERGGEVIDNAVATLRSWLVAQLAAMSVVGVLTGVGLWLVGIPVALLLGVIAGLLAFIPNIGPVIAAAPAVLLSLSLGWSATLWVVAVYVGVQTLESYVITPYLQQEQVSLPPVLIIGMQLLFGVLFGLVGLMMATPFAALAMSVTRDLYIGDYLDRPADP